jgi:glycine betaine/proline transport system substrate-binding protein
MRSRAALKVGLVAASAALVLAACANQSGSSGSTGAAGASGAADCGTVNMADNAWTGYEADVAVVNYLMTNYLGCDVKLAHVAEQVGWQGFQTGQTDVILENWGHEDLAKKYITDAKLAVDLGPNGNEGTIGWYVPQWMADKYPDITDWKNLNKYANLFVTPESGGKGQVLDGDPSFVTNDAALVKNLNLNYQVVVGGSEDALIKSLETATQQKTALLFYFWEPQYLISTKTAPSTYSKAIPVAKVNLPPYTPGCDQPATATNCDYPPYHLNKIARAAWVNSGNPAATLVKNFTWTNADQNLVATDIAGGMTDDQAAQKWLAANPDVWMPWFDGTGVTPSPVASPTSS